MDERPMAATERPIAGASRSITTEDKIRLAGDIHARLIDLILMEDQRKERESKENNIMAMHSSQIFDDIRKITRR